MSYQSTYDAMPPLASASYSTPDGMYSPASVDAMYHPVADAAYSQDLRYDPREIIYYPEYPVMPRASPESAYEYATREYPPVRRSPETARDGRAVRTSPETTRDKVYSGRERSPERMRVPTPATRRAPSTIRGKARQPPRKFERLTLAVYWRLEELFAGGSLRPSEVTTKTIDCLARSHEYTSLYVLDLFEEKVAHGNAGKYLELMALRSCGGRR